MMQQTRTCKPTMSNIYIYAITDNWFHFSFYDDRRIGRFFNIIPTLTI